MHSHSCAPQAWHGDDHHCHNCIAKHSTVELALQQPACQHEKSTHRQQCKPKFRSCLWIAIGGQPAPIKPPARIPVSRCHCGPRHLLRWPMLHVSHSMSTLARCCAHSFYLPHRLVVGRTLERTALLRNSYKHPQPVTCLGLVQAQGLIRPFTGCCHLIIPGNQKTDFRNPGLNSRPLLPFKVGLGI